MPLNNKNLYSAYSVSYEGADLVSFRKMCNKAFLKWKCGEQYVKNIKIDCPPLSFKQGAINQAAEQAARVFLRDGYRYAVLQGWLCDSDSRRLLALEILQKALKTAQFTDEEAAEAICTGVTRSQWAQLLEKGRDNSYLTDYVGRKDYSAEVNDGIIAGSKMEKVGDGGTVVSFEPIAAQMETLQENVRRASALHKTKVLVANAAVCNDNGYTYFVDDDESAHGASGGGVRVNTVRIDDYCREYNVNPTYIFYMKKSGWINSTVLFAVP